MCIGLLFCFASIILIIIVIISQVAFKLDHQVL